jgi:hypothetical protein
LQLDLLFDERKIEENKRMKMNTYTNDKFTLVLFVIYTIFYESLVWGLTASAIYFLNWSWPIIIVAMVMSSAQLKYKSFYVTSDMKKTKNIELDLDKK